MTKPKKYVWAFTFVDPEEEVVATIRDDSPAFSTLRLDNDFYVGSASLIDTSFEGGERDQIVHYVPLSPCSIKKVFTRVENNLTSSTVSRIPAFTYSPVASTRPHYCFAYKERVIYTEDQNFYSTALSSLEG